MGDCAEFLSALLEKAHDCSAAEVSLLAILHPMECLIEQPGLLSHLVTCFVMYRDAGGCGRCNLPARLIMAAAHAVLCMFYREERVLLTTSFRARWCRV